MSGWKDTMEKVKAMKAEDIKEREESTYLRQRFKITTDRMLDKMEELTNDHLFALGAMNLGTSIANEKNPEYMTQKMCDESKAAFDELKAAIQKAKSRVNAAWDEYEANRVFEDMPKPAEKKEEIPWMDEDGATYKVI